MSIQYHTESVEFSPVIVEHEPEIEIEHVFTLRELDAIAGLVNELKVVEENAAKLGVSGQLAMADLKDRITCWTTAFVESLQ